METASSTARMASVGASVLLVGVATFQVALGLGAPWGADVYGGRVETSGGTLPVGHRVMSLAAAPLLALAAWVLLARTGVVGRGQVRPVVIARATWAIAAYLAVNTVGNLASASTIERWGLGTVTAVSAALALHVARSAPSSLTAHEPNGVEAVRSRGVA